MTAYYSEYICLSSRACLETFPSNTSTAFSNLLPRPIINRENKTYYLKLHGVSLVNKFSDMSFDWYKSYLRIHIKEVSEQRHGQGFMHLVGGLTFPTDNVVGNGVGVHIFQHTPYLPLRFQHLTKLEVIITDRENQVVELEEGPPTLIWFKMTDQPDDLQFTITCTSNHPTLYPANDLNIFTSPLPSEMELGAYEVALLQLVFPPEMHEMSQRMALRIGDDYLLDIPISRLRTIPDILNLIKRDLNQSKYKKYFTIGVRNNLQGGGFFRRSNKPDPDRGNQPIYVWFNEVFAKIFDSDKSSNFSTMMHLGETINLNSRNRPPNIYNVLPNPVAMLHCNLVESNVVAGRQGNLLQCVPVYLDRLGDEKRLYEPEQLAYHAVKTSPISSIKFSFLNEMGQSRGFESNSPANDIMITLLFRLRKQRNLLPEMSE